jgi:hypothetical protein
MLREEELKWYQRAKAKNLLQGDANTQYFHLLANGRHRKTRIFKLQDGNNVIEGDENLKRHITSYYKDLFGPPEASHITLDDSIRGDISQVSVEENQRLTDRFSEEEVKAALFQMEKNKASGPDGFPAEFWQVFWDVIKKDLMAMFDSFYDSLLPIHSINFGTIILIPNSSDTNSIQQYRPICLLNVSFKIFTKVLANRLTTVANKVISPTQSAFLSGRNIMEGVVVLHETLHELHRRQLDGVVFKIDFEKVYDKVKWPFVRQTLRMKGFDDKWCAWVDAIMKKGHVAIKVNNYTGNTFETKKGLR